MRAKTKIKIKKVASVDAKRAKDEIRALRRRLEKAQADIVHKDSRIGRAMAINDRHEEFKKEAEKKLLVVKLHASNAIKSRKESQSDYAAYEKIAEEEKQDQSEMLENAEEAITELMEERDTARQLVEQYRESMLQNGVDPDAGGSSDAGETARRRLEAAEMLKEGALMASGGGAAGGIGGGGEGGEAAGGDVSDASSGDEDGSSDDASSGDDEFPGSVLVGGGVADGRGERHPSSGDEEPDTFAEEVPPPTYDTSGYDMMSMGLAAIREWSQEPGSDLGSNFGSDLDSDDNAGDNAAAGDGGLDGFLEEEFGLGAPAAAPRPGSGVSGGSGTAGGTSSAANVGGYPGAHLFASPDDHLGRGGSGGGGGRHGTGSKGGPTVITPAPADTASRKSSGSGKSNACSVM